jgi:predicted ABC-type transport system involved in lysophospholipase L1 biosynthesis ATPase subunit
MLVPALQLDVTITRGRQCVSLRGELEDGGLAVAGAVPGEAAPLARAIAVETPPGGQVAVAGVDVAGNEPDDRDVGYVPAGGQLLPQFTLRGNIEYGLRRRITAERFVESRVEQASERLDLGLVLDLHPHEVTPDERLRAAVARAAVRLPRVLVLELPDARVDDGTGGPVDPVDLPWLADAASMSDLFELAMVVLSADEAALDQVDERWPVRRRACDEVGGEAGGDPSPARATGPVGC